MSFKLSELRCTSALSSLEGIEGFSASAASYPKTLFRFPLRYKPSDLSQSSYTVDKLTKLVDALRDEAKLLLLFLRSVHTVEVYSISSSRRKQTMLHLQVQIAPECQIKLSQERTSFVDKLKDTHKLREYDISRTISSVSKFALSIKDIKNEQVLQSATWLVASQVGSSKKDVLEAAKMQRCFPWVGVAMELGNTVPSGPGRVFCFLPMPAETTSNLPVHVNGTFGLNDDRRTIKWPGGERRNDPNAQWNRKLLTECLPLCYNMLLRRAVAKEHISPKLFYDNWPCVDMLMGTNWFHVVEPLIQLIFQWECLWAQEQRKWVRISQNVVLYNRSTSPPDIVKRALTACGLQLCEVPEHVYKAVYTRQSDVVKHLSPSLVCCSLRKCSSSYKNEHYKEKLKLLHFCLNDPDYSNLIGLQLLPVADGTFKSFNRISLFGDSCYICSRDYPRKLLPNIDSELVDLSKVDKDLHSKLQKVAQSSITHLKVLSVQLIAQLLNKSYPHNWAMKSTVAVKQGDHKFPYGWWETFWQWVQNHVSDLSPFVGQHVVPLVSSRDPDEMRATKLRTNSDVVVITTANGSPSTALLSAFQQLQVKCVMLEHFENLRHRQLFGYLNQYNPVGVLNATANSSCNIQGVNFTWQYFHAVETGWSLLKRVIQ